MDRGTEPGLRPGCGAAVGVGDEDRVNRYLTGAVAGLLATAPMTLAMLAMFRRLPREEQYPLPPAEITAVAAEKAHVDEALEPEPVALGATLAAHFGYGAAAGAVYGPLSPLCPLPPLVKGSLFGLAVWTVSYLGLLPAAGILTPATEHPARRNALMIAANLLWGGVTALLTERLTDPSDGQ